VPLPHRSFYNLFISGNYCSGTGNRAGAISVTVTVTLSGSVADPDSGESLLQEHPERSESHLDCAL
jgi:hypothetical protein